MANAVGWDDEHGTIRENIVTEHRGQGQPPVATSALTTASASGAGCPHAAARAAERTRAGCVGQRVTVPPAGRGGSSNSMS